MHFSAIFLPLLFGAGHVCAIQIATWNVRYDSKTDAIPVAESKGKTQLQGERGSEQPWSTRRIGIANYLATHKVSVLGVQEALIRQVKDLQELFGTDWAWVGEGRDDGKEKGEYCAIFYNRKDVTLSSNETFWLSQTPLEPSKYTGAGSPRLATVAKFTTVDGKPFSIINTHLDDQSNEQRMVGASMLRVRAKFEAYNGGANDGKVFILGDFNSQQDGEDSGAYKIATGSQDVNLNGVAPTWVEAYKVPEGQLNEFKMLDLRSETPRGSVSGPEETFTGFSAEQKPQASKKVDFILGGSNKGWEAKTYTVGEVLNDDGVLLSDHRPVIVEVGL